jgi:hypothetical protein
MKRTDGLICESLAFRVADHIVPHAHVLKLPMEAFSRDPEWVAPAECRPADQEQFFSIFIKKAARGAGAEKSQASFKLTRTKPGGKTAA